MHCITIHPEIKVNSDVNLASWALHLVVELQFELSAMVIARQRKSLCNGAQCAMVHNVQWCTMCNGAQCSAVLYSAHTRCGMCGAAHTQLTPQPALRCMHYILQGLKFQLRVHRGFICSDMHSDCSAIKVLAVHTCVMLTAMHT